MRWPANFKGEPTMITYDDDSGRCSMECRKGWLPLDGIEGRNSDYEPRRNPLLFPVLERRLSLFSGHAMNDDLRE